jgi:membrane associated rhomboid family serine protease
MIPLRDDQPRFTTPYVNYFLIGLNLLIYFFQATLDPESGRILAFQLGFIPAHVTGLLNGTGHLDLASVLLPFLTSMFLHATWFHVIGNMLFLWIFGDNIEDHMGHARYLGFYLLSGIAAASAQVLLTPQLNAPTVGASGAIAGVLGAYFILYPRARVLTWFPPIFLFYLPAWILLGGWFGLQFLSGILPYSDGRHHDQNIAFWAHVGGFVAGILLVKLLPQRPRRYRYGTW